MATLIRFKLDGGGEVFVESAPGGEVGSFVSGGTIEAPYTFEKAVAQIRPVTEAVMRELECLATKPDEIAVEFGVTLKAEGGIVLAKVATEGSIKLTLKWKPSGP